MMDLQTRLFELRSKRQKIQNKIDKNELLYKHQLKIDAEHLKQTQEIINFILRNDCKICDVCGGTGEIEYMVGYGFGEVKDCPACNGRGVTKS